MIIGYLGPWDSGYYESKGKQNTASQGELALMGFFSLRSPFPEPVQTWVCDN